MKTTLLTVLSVCALTFSAASSAAYSTTGTLIFKDMVPTVCGVESEGNTYTAEGISFKNAKSKEHVTLQLINNVDKSTTTIGLEPTSWPNGAAESDVSFYVQQGSTFDENSGTPTKIAHVDASNPVLIGAYVDVNTGQITAGPAVVKATLTVTCK